MESTATSIIMTPADFADTGQWRLIIYVSAAEMGAVLRHVSDPKRPAVQLFDERWAPLSGSQLLEKIENVVYDHPSLMDDYATEIIVGGSRLTWVPSCMLEEPSEELVEGIEDLLGERFSETLVDTIDDMTVAYALAPGFDSFMARTIPGAKMRSRMAVLVSRLRTLTTTEGISVFAFRDAMASYLVVFGDGELLCASESGECKPEGLKIRVDEALRAWGSPGKSSKVYIYDYISDTANYDYASAYIEGDAEIEMLAMPEEVMLSRLPLGAALTVFRQEWEDFLRNR